MSLCLRALVLPAFLFGGLFALLSAPLVHAASVPERGTHPTPHRAQTLGSKEAAPGPSDREKESTEASSTTSSDAPPAIDVLEGIRSGQLAANAVGSGDGRMTLNLTNRSNRKLRVVLPPGLIATGASGQFGGMGGMRGGMGGMGMGGMGMGGMGGMGMGGMGMGGMGGMGRMGGGMMGGRGMMGGGTMPASMGMMMLGRLIMSLVGDRDSWDQTSLMSGMMGGMGGMGMGRMGGMGGMGMGMGGGMMGGGFRSVPPTGLPETTLKPRQTRHLPTGLVSLNRPSNLRSVNYPAKGEKLAIGDVSQLPLDLQSRSALKLLAAQKAPQTISQLVMWKTGAGMEWSTIEELSKEWANPAEVALARRFVAELDEAREAAMTTAESGTIYCEVRARNDASVNLATNLEGLLKKTMMLGLRTEEIIPANPVGPAIGFRAAVDGTVAEVQVVTTKGPGSVWIPRGMFTIELKDRMAASKSSDTSDKSRNARIIDSIAEGILGQLVHCQLSHGQSSKGKRTYKLRIDNGSPLVLNGLTLGSAAADADGDETALSTLAGLSLSPWRSWTISVTADAVDRLRLKKGVELLAADLGEL